MRSTLQSTLKYPTYWFLETSIRVKKSWAEQGEQRDWLLCIYDNAWRLNLSRFTKIFQQEPGTVSKPIKVFFPFHKLFKTSNLLIFRIFKESRRAELSRVSEEIDYFVSMTMPGGRIYRGFLPLLRGSSRKFSSKSLELHHNNVWPNEKRH